MHLYYNNKYYLLKFKNKIIFKQYYFNNNKNYTYLYIIHILYKLGLVKIN